MADEKKPYEYDPNQAKQPDSLPVPRLGPDDVILPTEAGPVEVE